MKSSPPDPEIALTSRLYPTESAKRATSHPTASPPIPTVVPLSSSQKAQAAKRLDWRFFLPHPALKQVGYWGPSQNQLMTALAIFAQELTILTGTIETNSAPTRSGLTSEHISPEGVVGQSRNSVSNKRQLSEQDHQQRLFDLVVLSNPTADVLQRAPSWVQPGGAIYVEAHGALWPQRWLQRHTMRTIYRQPFLLRPKDYSAILQQNGLKRVQALWIWPSFNNSTKIIPLDAPNVLSYVSASPQGKRLDFRSARKAFYQKWLLPNEWFTLLMPCFSLIAH
jgi:hypothetical protein